MTGFQVYYDAAGNLTVQNGWVLQPKTGVAIAVGIDTGVVPSGLAKARDLELSDRVATAAQTGVFVGGSGRNLMVTGLPIAASGTQPPIGFFRPTNTAKWQSLLGNYKIEKTGPSAATLSDGVGVIATLTSGGTAPIGSYAGTTYGRANYNGGTAFALTCAAESLPAGGLPNASVLISNGTAQGGIYNAVTAESYVSAANPDWTLEILSSGQAKIKHLTDVVAVRSAGLTHDPAGVYEAASTAYDYYLVPLPDGEGELTPANPFGIITITYGDGVIFLKNYTTLETDLGTYRIGSGYGTSGAFMNFLGNGEVTTVDLATAWEFGYITSSARLILRADWFAYADTNPSNAIFPEPKSGPVSLVISCSVNGILFSGTINPGSTTGTPTTVARDLTIDAVEGLFDPPPPLPSPWRAHVSLVRALPKPGFVYLQMVRSGGVLLAVNGPYFATTMPSPSGETSYVALAACDGSQIEQYVTGAIILDAAPATTTGLAWSVLTAAQYDALTTIDPNTIYDITDAPWED